VFERLSGETEMITWGLLALAAGSLIAYGCRTALKRPNPSYVQAILNGKVERNRPEERRFRRNAAHS
jgi:hypothetical protein